jgi:DNA-binding transcriptional ArsR family regulator
MFWPGQSPVNSTNWLTFVSSRQIFNFMVEYQAPALDTVFQALTDATRRAMLRSLADGDRNIGELAAPFDMSLAAASKHVKVLERAGLVRRLVKGRTHICRLESAPLAAADEWLRFYEQFWNRKLDALDALLKAEDAAAGKPQPKG